jgi:hypothetical protein
MALLGPQLLHQSTRIKTLSTFQINASPTRRCGRFNNPNVALTEISILDLIFNSFEVCFEHALIIRHDKCFREKVIIQFAKSFLHFIQVDAQFVLPCHLPASREMVDLLIFTKSTIDIVLRPICCEKNIPIMSISAKKMIVF